jgi:hypothetical protein
VYRPKFDITVSEYGVDPAPQVAFSDENLSVTPVVLLPEDSVAPTAAAAAAAAAAAVADESPAARPHKRVHIAPGCTDDAARSMPEAVACYIARMHPIPGKFDVARARALGVPPGPLFSASPRVPCAGAADGRRRRQAG